MRLFLTNLHFASSRIKNNANNVSFLLKSFHKIEKLNEKKDKSQKKINNNNKVLKNENLLKLKTEKQQKNLFNEINNNIESLEKLNLNLDLNLDKINPSTIEVINTDLTESNLKNVSNNHPLDDCDYEKVNALYGYKKFAGYNDSNKDVPCSGVRWQSKTPCEEQIALCGYKNKLQCVTQKFKKRVDYNYTHRAARKERV